MTRKIALILALVLSAVAAPVAHAYLPQGFIGVSPQSPASSADFELMREAGVDSVRRPLNWSSIQPLSPTAADPDWDGFDHEVGLAAEAGIRIMPFLTASPEWVAPQPLVLPVNSVLQRGAWASFLREAV